MQWRSSKNGVVRFAGDGKVQLKCGGDGPMSCYLGSESCKSHVKNVQLKVASAWAMQQGVSAANSSGVMRVLSASAKSAFCERCVADPLQTTTVIL